MTVEIHAIKWTDRSVIAPTGTWRVATLGKAAMRAERLAVLNFTGVSIGGPAIVDCGVSTTAHPDKIRPPVVFNDILGDIPICGAFIAIQRFGFLAAVH